MARDVAIERVGFRYGATAVLDDVTLAVAPGEFFAFLGPSGSGKTTLLRLIAGFGTPSSGRILIGGHDVTALPPWKRNVGMVFQSYHLIDDLTVQENIDLPLSYKDIAKSERQAMVADTLDRFQIVAKKDLYPSQLSGGQQQLVGVARAIIHKPALLLADEPTGNLHSSQAKEIMELFCELNREGTTIVQVTHSEANAAFGGRTIQLRDGWIVSEERNAPREVVAR